MADRLILGSGSLVSPVARAVDGPVLVGTPDEDLASALRGAGIEAESIDPTDEQVLSALDVDLVFVLEDSEESALATARAVDTALPNAYLLASAGPSTATGDTPLSSLADRVFDPGRAVAERVLACAGKPQLPQLWTVLRGLDHLAVVAHNNPDPDALASGVALARLAGEADCEAEVCYYGDISHHENRAFVNALELDLRNLDADADLAAFDGLALVDHARPGINDQLPEDTPVDIIIDHHPPRGPVEARFVDLRSEFGATCTMLVEHLERYGKEIDSDVATALLFGIHVDTDGFTRSVTTQDFDATATLVEAADLETLEQMRSPSVDRGTFDVLALAIDERRVEGDVALSFVGTVGNRDVLPQAADRLLNVDGITTTAVYGLVDETVHVSARSRSGELDLGEVVREAFGEMGAAGGHTDMAGAQIHLGLFGDLADAESLAPLIDSHIADRFLDALDDSPSQPPRRPARDDDHPDSEGTDG